VKIRDKAAIECGNAIFEDDMFKDGFIEKIIYGMDTEFFYKFEDSMEDDDERIEYLTSEYYRQHNRMFEHPYSYAAIAYYGDNRAFPSQLEKTVKVVVDGLGLKLSMLPNEEISKSFFARKGVFMELYGLIIIDGDDVVVLDGITPYFCSVKDLL
jgi:hypothetical protein